MFQSTGSSRLLILFAILVIKHVTSACESSECKLPDCLCMSTNPPNGLDPQNIPQLVFLTFDDAISNWMYPTYERIFRNRTNPNGCPITMTFYVTHDNTNYRLVNEFYNKGNEIASHTVTHKNDMDYWKNTNTEFWEREAGQQREIIQSYSNVPLDRVKGFRAPYLQTGGDATFTALQSLAMTYDSSLPTVNYMDPPIWPFTMDYGVTHDCTIPPCSNEAHNGFWDVPMVAFRSNENGSLCSMPDSCFTPDIAANLSAKEIFEYFMYNFQRYNGTRTPFGIYQHIYWFGSNSAILDGFIEFLNYLATLDYVYIVTVGKGLEWIRNPLTLEELKYNDIFSCKTNSSDLAPCPNPKDCYYPESVPGGERTMGSCTFCPAEYPWLVDPVTNSAIGDLKMIQ